MRGNLYKLALLTVVVLLILSFTTLKKRMLRVYFSDENLRFCESALKEMSFKYSIVREEGEADLVFNSKNMITYHSQSFHLFWNQEVVDNVKQILAQILSESAGGQVQNWDVLTDLFGQYQEGNIFKDRVVILRAADDAGFESLASAILNDILNSKATIFENGFLMMPVRVIAQTEGTVVADFIYDPVTHTVTYNSGGE
ncbi:MAG: hypothetical protein DRP33_07120 [Thermotogae bacterium]|nr:MAG: hypothetical protein DRP33_07120 [Thermotogota bacterium]